MYMLLLRVSQFSFTSTSRGSSSSLRFPGVKLLLNVSMATFEEWSAITVRADEF